jgi:phosphoribosylaminoimidazolecarboxamide formyltransferase/IMP cyclohydrolase
MSNNPRIKRALLSVSDKRGLADLARVLVDNGVELVSTGGTARAIAAAGLPVTPVSDLTGFPEIFGGRVKTLHPKVHGGILGRWDESAHRAEAEANGIEPIGLVVVNLYPFRETIARDGVTLSEAIEQIDIGGPTMVRSAAKNHAHTAIVVDPDDYGRVGEAVAEGGLSGGLRLELATKAFRHTADYDAAIAGYLEARDASEEDPLPEQLSLAAPRIATLRYGENPHQRAGFYALAGKPGEPSLAAAEQLQGKALSFNNLLDLDAALTIALDLPGRGAVVIKHCNPCGAANAVTDDEPLADVYARARATDPVSAFGGIVGLNQPVDGATAALIAETFLECVVAPAYEEEALAILGRKKNLRLMRLDPWPTPVPTLDIRRVSGGLLVQDRDTSLEDVREAHVATKRAPTDAEWAALGFAWRVCKHVKSNAIVYARTGQLIGVGAGQMSRVDSSRIAAEAARRHGHDLAGSVIASDAFFPFPDGVEVAAEAGATAVVQPGGSKRDAEVIAAADALGLAMVLTGVRHFRH